MWHVLLQADRSVTVVEVWSGLGLGLGSAHCRQGLEGQAMSVLCCIGSGEPGRLFHLEH